MSRLFKFLTLVFVMTSYLLASGCSAQSEQRSPKKIVAYLPAWSIPTYTPHWEQITHLCLAFGFVQADGNVDVTEVRKQRFIIREAHKHNVQVLLSIGGGGSRNFSSAILNEASRRTLVKQLALLTEELELDGIDVDFEEWEGGAGGASESDVKKRTALENLYSELRKSLGPNKLLAAAVGASWDTGGFGTYNCYQPSMHHYLDFVSLMIYDATGPWPTSSVGQHSDWNFFEKGIHQWLINQQLPKEKLVAGVPFYGYLFSEGGNIKDTRSVTYKQILEMYPQQDAHLKDNIGLLFYNGMPTIQRKTEYIKEQQLGGIMIWEISQDTDDSNRSLLHLIYQSIINNK